MTKLWAITANAFVQTIRQPLYSILLLVTFVVLVVTVAMTGFSMEAEMVEGDVRLLVDFGLSTILFSGLFIAAFSAAQVLTREIEQKTVLTVVSKPTPRPLILLGKFIGVAMAVTLATYLMSIVFLLTVRHGVMSRANTPYDPVTITMGLTALGATLATAVFCNYFFGWQVAGTGVGAGAVLFTAAGVVVGFFNRDWQLIPFAEGINPQIVLVLVLIWMALLIITALAIAVSSRLGQAATLLVCVVAALAGVIGEARLRPLAEENILAKIAYWIMPNLAYFFNLDALTMGRQITGGYMALAAAYAACYTAALLAVGMALFQGREMDARRSGSMAPILVNLFAWYLRIIALVAAVAGLSALVQATGRDAAMVAAAVTAAGPILWLFAGALGRGRRWALIVLWLATVGQVVGSVVYLVFLHPEAVSPLGRFALLTAIDLQAVFVLVMSLRRTTRDHFGMLAKAKPAVTGSPD